MKLRSYQKDVVDKVGSDSSLRLIISMTGSGKSLMAQRIVAGRKALVLTFASVAQQMQTYFPDDLVYSYNKFCMDKYLMGPIRDYVEEFEPVLVLDEASIIKNPQNKVCKILMKIKDYFEDIYMFSACPAPNGLHEYFMAGFLAGEFFGDNYNKFLSKYTYLMRGVEAIPNTGFNRKTYMAKGFKMRVKDEKAIRQIVKKFTYTVNEGEIKRQMPEQNFFTREYSLNSRQLKLYEIIKKEACMLIEDEKLPLKSKLASLTKLLQVESGFIYDENREVHSIGDSKLKALKDLLEEIGNEKVVIFTQFIEEARQIRHLLQPLSYADRAYDFQSGKYQYLIGHPASIGIGVSLEVARYCIFYSNSFSYEARLQSVGRIYRLSQKSKTCFYYDLMPKQKTISHYVFEVINRKQTLDEMVKTFIQKRISPTAKDNQLS